MTITANGIAKLVMYHLFTIIRVTNGITSIPTSRLTTGFKVALHPESNFNLEIILLNKSIVERILLIY